MKTALQSWLEGMTEFSGLLGAFVVAPDDQPGVRSWSDEFPLDGIRALHRQVGDVVEVLEAGHMPARKMRWIFERTVVYFERRKDGAGMCLITTHDPWAGEGDVISQLIGDFRSAV